MPDSVDLKNFDLLKQIIKKGDILVDVGANQGDYTDFFKNIIEGDGKIYSIELHSENINILKSKFNKFEFISILNFAISDVDGDINYFRGEDSFKHNIIGHDMSFKPNELLGVIKSVRLDTLLSSENKINLIKIDVEGAELQVLKGIIGIKNKIENILVECHLDQHWFEIKEILINTLHMECLNVLTGEKIDVNSSRPYQCYCKKKYVG
jgi:FkbM family methyltransferase